MPGYSFGLRNNNPGNIRAGDNWKGMIGTNQGFVVFENIAWGLRALALDLSNKIAKGYNTIEAIITRYAPPQDNNNTESYIQSMVSSTGFARDKLLQANTATIAALIKGMVKVENGYPSYTYITDSDISEGISMVNSITPGQAAVGFTISTAMFLFALYLLLTTPKLPRK